MTRKKLPTVTREGVGAQVDIRGGVEDRRSDTGKLSKTTDGVYMYRTGTKGED